MSFNVVGTGTNNMAAKWRFRLACEYLRHSALAASIIEDLENAGQVITVHVGPECVAQWIPPGHGAANSGGTIEWDPNATGQVVDRPEHRPNAPWLARGGPAQHGVASASLMLFHEMVHALQYLANAAQMVGPGVNVLAVENFVVQGVEATVARELRGSGRMEGVRWEYHDAA